MRQTHWPAEKLFVDFAGDTVPVFDTTAKERRVHVFVGCWERGRALAGRGVRLEEAGNLLLVKRIDPSTVWNLVPPNGFSGSLA